MSPASPDADDNRTTLMVPEGPFDAGAWSEDLAAEHTGGTREDLGAIEAPRFGRYVILGPIGRGGMGRVFEAFDPTLDRRVAIKVLHRRADAQHDRRMLREAQALAKLSHPNVVQVYEVGEVDGQLFVAMELVAGRTLRQWAADSPAPDWRASVEVYRQAGEGLAAAHAVGLVHRDFKPDNAMIDEAGRVRVLDFGLARAFDDDAAPSLPPTEREAPIETQPSITRTGTVMGTPAYMSPEQLSRRPLGAPSDQFSLCVALYEAIWRERPFEGDSVPALRTAVVEGRLRAVPRSPAVPEALVRTLRRGLATDPDARWPSMDALLSELRRITTPDRRAPRAIAIGIGLVAVGLAWWRGAATGSRELGPAPCQGAHAQLDGVWDETRDAAVRAAILGTEQSFADDTWTRVDALLDGYAAHWVAERTDACEATHVRHEQSEEVLDLRMGCLQRQRIALREVVSVLLETDPARAREAVNLVSGLPDPERCRDIEALRSDLPPPSTPDLAQRVEHERERLARVVSLHRVGAYERGLAEAETVVEHAESLGYAPLVAEARLRRGQMRQRRNQLAEAEADFEAAYLLAAQLRHHEIEALAAVELTNVVGGTQARHEPGARWGRIAVALGRGLHEDPGVQAHALNALGRVENQQGHSDRALALFREALATTERVRGVDHPETALELNNLGIALAQRGELTQALSVLERALAIKRAAYGERHPEVASTLENLGIVLGELERHDAALEHFEQALEIKRAAYGEGHVRVGLTHDNIGTTLIDRGELDRAREHLERARSILEQAVGREHLHTARAVHNLAVALEKAGERDQALRHYRDALASWETTLGPDHPNVGTASTNVGRLLRLRGDTDEAWDRLERGRVIAEASYGTEHPQVADALVGLAEVALDRDDVETARPLAERALAIREASEVPAHARAEARFVLARVLDPRDRARAIELARRARDAYAGPVYQREREAVDAWLVARGATDPGAEGGDVAPAPRR